MTYYYWNDDVEMNGFSKKEIALFKKLKSPAKVQDFLNSIPANMERGGETCRSPLSTLRAGEAHCMEGSALDLER